MNRMMTIIVATVGQGIMRGRNGGESWISSGIDQGMRPAHPRAVFTGSRNGFLYRSDDGGDSWYKERREFSKIYAITWVPS